VKRRRGLALSIGLVTTAVAFLAVLLSALVSVHLVRSAVTQSARDQLARDADLIASIAPGRPIATRSRQLLRASGLSIDVVSPLGVVRGDDPLSATDVATLQSGRSLSSERTVDGQSQVIEGRPLVNGGAVVLSQAAGISPTTAHRIRVAEILAVLVGLLGGALAGILLARRLARPLVAAAEGARRLGSGDRSERIAVHGPLEVADVATSLNSLGDALATSEARQRGFLTSVSHELRTPLTAIRGFSEALADGVTAAGDVPRVGGVMLAEAERLDRLVSDLLDLARLGAQDFRVEITSVDLIALVSAAADVWRARCDAERVVFSVSLPASPVSVASDPLRLRQIVDGLAENALRVTPAGAPIVFAVSADAAAVSVEVRDGGPGISDEDIAVAYDRSVLFEKYRGERRVGTGLGLALVGGLAARLGGTAYAGHAPEGGATFGVRLPVGS
jgi:two-component system sensor histidine kinase BaeS